MFDKSVFNLIFNFNLCSFAVQFNKITKNFNLLMEIIGTASGWLRTFN